MSRHGSMNRVYRVVWNVRRRVWQTAAETCGRQRRGALSTGGLGPSAPQLAAGALLLILIPFTARAGSLPDGGRVVAGDASIGRQGDTLTIDQTSHNAAIDWRRFSVGEGNTVRFNQPGRDAATLNRVTGGEVSSIRGAIEANGRVFLVNPNGVHFSSTARVDVGALVASTLDITTDDFMNGDYRFSGDSANAVINQGNIRTSQGGLVAMIAAEIVNTGDITTPRGSTLMAAGSIVTLDLGGPVSIEVKEARLDTLIEQGGAIRADGGLVYLTAKAAGDLAASVINHTGMTRARTLAAGENGEIRLMGDMDHGSVQVAGTLDAGAPASLNPEGGDGGSIETSAAKVKVADEARVTTRADLGKTGEWLIDPSDFTVSAGGAGETDSGIGADTLSENLADNSITLQTVESGGGNGDIFVNDGVTWQSGTTLTLNAHRDIEINATIDAAQGSGGKLALEYGQGSNDGQIGGRAAEYRVNAPVNLQAGNNFSTKLGSDGDAIDYTVITDLGAAGSTTGEDLQGMSGNLGGHYALGANIDASDTASWNGDAGFAPVGDGDNDFAGTFDGLGHTISDLTIIDTSCAGMFGAVGTGGRVSNVGLVGGSVEGSYAAGGLVGKNQGTIRAVYATGRVSGSESVGGLVGLNESGGTVSNAYATGAVNGSDDTYYMGGLVGYNKGTVSNAYSTGAVQGGNTFIGGLVGLNKGTISNAYATGAVTGMYAVGGLVGYNDGTITASFFDRNSTGQSQGVGGGDNGVTELTTDEMKNAEHFTDAGWDSSVWTFSGADSSAPGYRITDAQPFLTSVTREEDIVGSSGTLFEGGLGTADNPFTITSWEQLQNLNYSGDTLRGGYDYSLSNNLGTGTAGYEDYASATANSGKGWRPISEGESNGFTGTFDGLGHTISDLIINRSDARGIGLFGYVAKDGTVRNVGLLGVSVTGQDYVGGLVGLNNGGTISNTYSTGSVTGRNNVGGLVGRKNGGTISKAYATGSVTGSDYNVGGLVGLAHEGAIISNAYATSSVKGQGRVGGLVGYNSGSTISNAYATGSVNGQTYVGGLVGFNYGTITASFFDTVSTGQSQGVGSDDNDTGVTGLTTDEMKKTEHFINAGWDSSVWTFSGADSSAPGYRFADVLPYLTVVTRDEDIVGSSGTLFEGGLGTADNPFTITSWEQLQNLNYSGDTLRGGYDYSLSNNLGSGTAGYEDYASATANSGKGWRPIGDFANMSGLDPFIGTLDGLGHTISDLNINLPDTGAVGLFGYVKEGGAVRNIGLIGGSVIGDYNVGGLAGLNSGTIETAYSTSKVKGGTEMSNSVGGLVGHNNGTIQNAYATGSVAGYKDVGGLVGWNVGVIQSAYAMGSVRGDPRVGGLVGRNDGTIQHAYATGDVDGGSYAGGLVGWNYGGTETKANISNAYATGDVDVDEDGYGGVGGLVGLNDGTIQNAYATGSVAGYKKSGGLVGWNAGTIQHAYATGGVDRGSYVGGLVGLNEGTMTNAYYATTNSDGSRINSGDGYNSLGEGKSLADLKKQDTFADWGGDIDAAGGTGTVWRIYEGFTTPLLRTFLKQVTVTVNDKAGRTYNGTEVTVSGSGHTLSDETASLLGSADYTHVTTRNAGDYALDISGLYSGQQGYDIKVETGRYTVDKATLTLNAVTDSKAYDGGTTSTGQVTHGTLHGTDSLTGLSQSFDSKNADDNRTLTVDGGYTLADGNGGNNYTVTTSTANGSITRRTLTISGTSAADKTYDGSTTASMTAGTLGNLVTGESLSVTATGEFDEANAGDRTATAHYTLADGGNGGLADNYVLADTTGHQATIDRRALTISGTTATGKTYDGSTTASMTAGTLGNLVTGESLGVTASGNFDSSNAGDRTATANYTLSNDSGLASNYVLADTSGHQARISRRRIGAAISAADRVYDGTRNATVSGSLNERSGDTGLIGGDDLSLAVNGQFADKNAGDDKTVSYNDAALSGDDAGNYTFTGEASGTTTASISQREIGATVSAADRVYDGTRNAAVSGTLNERSDDTGLINGDDLSLAVSGEFADKNAGDDKTVNYNDAALKGDAAGNYIFADASSGTTTASISQREIGATVSAADRVYDGTRNATVSGTLNERSDDTGLINGDDLSLAVNGQFADKNAGDDKTVNYNDAALKGDAAGNYTFTDASSGTTTASISRREIGAAISATDRVYDGTRNATVSGALNERSDDTGLINGDDLSLAVNGQFADKNAGDDKTVNYNDAALKGDAAGNYTFTGEASGTTTASISQREIGATVSAADRVYDGTRNAAVSGTLNERSDDTGLINGDDLSLAVSGEFTDKNAGDDKTVNYKGAALKGDAAGNYIFADASSGTTTASISQREIGATVSAADRVYDGTRNATVSGTLNARSDDTGLINGDDLSLAVSGEFSDKNAGDDKTVSYNDAALKGDAAGNYTFTDASSGTTTASISRREIGAAISATDRVYDGTRNATVSGALNERSDDTGLINGDDLSLAVSGEFSDKNAGADKTVSYNDAALSGDDAGNYIFTGEASGTTTASITPRSVTVTANDQRKIAGAADPALTYRTGCASGQTDDCGLVAGESLAGALGREAGEEAGDYAILQGTVTEARNANYVIDFVAGELVVDFSAGRPLVSALTALQRTTSQWGDEGPGVGMPAAPSASGLASGVTGGRGERVSDGLTLVRVDDEEGAESTRPGTGPLDMVVVGSGINTDSTDNSL